MLLAELNRSADVPRGTLLDIGGGIGAIQHELAKAGIREIYSVDASTAYLNSAKQEAQRQGLEDRVQYQHGDFVDVADRVPPADIVTLDRVLCCYDDVERLVRLSAERATKWYAIVYPRSEWWTAVAFAIGNSLLKLKGSSFRAYLHSSDYVESLVKECGLERVSFRTTPLWQVILYRR